MELEEWRDIPGFPGYQVSDLGRVKSFWRRTSNGIPGSTFDKWRWAITDRSRILPLPINRKHGYQTARLQKDGKQRLIPVHLLVLFAFVGPRPEGQQARHLSDDKNNNRLSNLAWGTASQNMQERHINRSTPVFKLTPKDIIDIRERLATGKETHKAIADSYNVSQPLVTRIKNGRRWAFVAQT